MYFLRLVGKKRTQRVYGPDLMRAMTALSARRGYRQFYYGGDVGLAEKLKETLVRTAPGLQVVGTFSPPFRALTPEEDRAIVDMINAARPDIVWVGLSTPKQERWMAAHREQIEAPVMVGVGAAFDFLAGTKRQAPLWMQRHGLEWLFRLCSEPKRLWRRYAYIVPGFSCLAAGELLQHAMRSRKSTGAMPSREAGKSKVGMRKIRVKDRSLVLGVDRNPLPHPKPHVVQEPASRSATAWAAISRIIFGTHVLALADQAVVSGTSLLSTVLVGRFTQPSQLGIYAIGLSVLGFVLAVQDALILMPYTIQRHRPSRSPAQHAGLALLHNAWLSVAAIVVLAIAAGVMIGFWAGKDLTWLVCTLVLTVPFALQREFNRTYAFAHLNVANALILDAGVAAVQLPLLAWLGWTDRMSAVSACIALGSACALTSIVWFYLARRNFSVPTGRVRQATAESWRLGKWLCAGQMAVTIQSYVSYWVLPLLISLVETGIFAACNSIASLANPLLSAFRNTLTPRSVLAFKEGGVERLRRQATRDALLLVGIMSLFWVVILFSGDTLMSVVYHDHGYDGRGSVVTILALAVLATAAGASASNAMASMERPRAVVFATSAGAVVTAAAVWAFTVEWGLIGAAYGILAGSVAGSVARWAAFLTIAARPGPADHVRAPIVQVLQQLAEPNPAVEWDIRQIGQGFQGRIYGIRTHRDDAVWQGYRDLAVKLYPDEPAAVETARRQFDAQVRLHGSVDGRTVHDWTLRAPLPLHVSEAPPALVMTMAAGTDLNKSLAAHSDQPPEVLAAMARVLVTVLQPHWAAGSAHGDLCLQNILYDPAHRILTLVDADRPVCAGAVLNRSDPAAYDLGVLLCDVATDIRTIDRRVALSKRTFAENALSAFLTMMEAPEREPELIAEIRAFARAELNLLDLRWSPRGLFRLIQRSIAMPRIDRMLATAQANVRMRHRLSVVGGRL